MCFHSLGKLIVVRLWEWTGVFIKDVQHRQRVSIFIKKAAGDQPATSAHGRFPPKNPLAPLVGRLQCNARDLVQEIALASRRIFASRSRASRTASGFDLAATTSLGFTLIRSLTEQIGGKLSLHKTNPGESRPGLCVVLIFPSSPHAS